MRRSSWNRPQLRLLSIFHKRAQSNEGFPEYLLGCGLILIILFKKSVRSAHINTETALKEYEHLEVMRCESEVIKERYHQILAMVTLFSSRRKYWRWSALERSFPLFPWTEPRDAATGDARRFRRHYKIKSFNAKEKISTMHVMTFKL